jgi:hypothetical protein
MTMLFLTFALRLKTTDRSVVPMRNLVKEIKAMLDKFDKHIIGECFKFPEIKSMLIKAVDYHRQVKDLTGKGDAKSVANAKK